MFHINSKFVGLLFCLFAGGALATPSIQDAFVLKYPCVKNSQLESCTTCHMPASKGFVNSYGDALQTAKYKFEAIEALDSDGDGKTNIDEITKLTFPGSQADTSELFPFANKNGTVTFHHGDHVMGANYKIMGDCLTCHDPKNTNHFAKIFDDKVSVMGKAHATCMGCHKASGLPTAPTKCADCHKKP